MNSQFFREIRLEKGRVYCGDEGLFIGPVPLLVQLVTSFNRRWMIRPVPALEMELSDLYGFDIDLTGKLEGLDAVARALNCGNLGGARISTLHLEFPNPPKLGKSLLSTEERFALAQELLRSGMLKIWNPDLHPRTGVKPNPGHFAEKPKNAAPETAQPDVPGVPDAHPGPDLKSARRFLRDWAKEHLNKLEEWGTKRLEAAQSALKEGGQTASQLANELKETAASDAESAAHSIAQAAEAAETPAPTAAQALEEGLEAAEELALPLADAAAQSNPVTAAITDGALATQMLEDARAALSPQPSPSPLPDLAPKLPVISNEDFEHLSKELDKFRLPEKIKKKFMDMAYALKELPGNLAYFRSAKFIQDKAFQTHHIVEQNPANLEKNDIVKFGRPAIFTSSNEVRIPTLAHERITADFNSAAEEFEKSSSQGMDPPANSEPSANSDPSVKGDSSPESDPPANGKKGPRKLKRHIVNEMDWGGQMNNNVDVMKKKGIIK